jgi:hypothetical protein
MGSSAANQKIVTVILCHDVIQTLKNIKRLEKAKDENGGEIIVFLILLEVGFFFATCFGIMNNKHTAI